MNHISLGEVIVYLVGLIIIGIVITIAILYLSNLFINRYPYFTHDFDISGKRKILSDEYVIKYLLNGGIDDIKQHQTLVVAWKEKHPNKNIDEDRTYMFRFVRYYSAGKHVVSLVKYYTYADLCMLYGLHAHPSVVNKHPYYSHNNSKDNLRQKTIVSDSINSKSTQLLPLYPNVLPIGMVQYLYEKRPMSISVFEQGYQYNKCENKTAYPGCYILYDADANKYYVGQSNDIWRRVHEHIVGKRNKNQKMQPIDNAISVGHTVYIRLMIIGTGNIYDLNEMERVLIAAYNSVSPNGYNLTKGNG